MSKSDPVNSPSHYAGDVGPIDLIESLGWGPAFCAGNVIKYTARHERKNGTEDLRKARWYLDRLIQLREAAK